MGINILKKFERFLTNVIIGVFTICLIILLTYSADAFLTGMLLIIISITIFSFVADMNYKSDRSDRSVKSESVTKIPRSYKQLERKSEEEIFREQLEDDNFAINRADSLSREVDIGWRSYDGTDLVNVESQDGVQIRIGKDYAQALYYQNADKLKVSLRLKNFEEDSMGIDPWVITTEEGEIKRMMLRDNELYDMLLSVSMSVRRIGFEITNHAIVRVYHDTESRRIAYNILRLMMKIMSFKFPWLIIPKPLDFAEVRSDSFKCSISASSALDKCTCVLPTCFICWDKIQCNERFTKLSCCSNFAHISEIRIWTSIKKSCPFCKAMIVI